MLRNAVLHEPGHQEVLEQVERITSSSLFRNSKRYPALLRYIAEEALAGRTENLKERALGIAVFGRNPDYDTNDDPVVRISAGEVRKRIAQYYQSSGHEQELRMEIPLGSYLPRFYRPEDSSNVDPLVSDERVVALEEDLQAPEHAAAVESLAANSPPLSAANAAPTPLLRTHTRLHIAMLYMGLLALACTWGVTAWRHSTERQLQPAIELFWGPFLRSPEPTLIVLGVHSFDAHGNDISASTHASLPQTEETLLWAMTRSDMVHLNDLTSYSQLTTLLTRHSHTFRTQGAADTTLEQLRQGPFILVGGFNNLWTTKLTSQLRFHFATLNGRTNVIQDSQHPERTWTIDTNQSALRNTRDYGIVSCFLDATTDQYVLIAAGIGKSGTEAASDFLTNDKELSGWLQKAKLSRGDNVQLVLSTDVIEGKHGAPHVIDAYRW